MDIGITVAGDELRGSLDDTATARDFAALLPLTSAAAGLILLGRLAPGATADLAHLTGTVTITSHPPADPGALVTAIGHAGHCDQARHPGHPEKPPHLLGSQPDPTEP